MGEVQVASHHKLQFPVLELPKVEIRRTKHRQLLKSLFPKPVRLRRLIHEIEKSHAKEIAKIIGSIDFAEHRLAGLLAALRELAEKTELAGKIEPQELAVQVQSDPRIHEALEELVIESCSSS